MEIAEEQKDAPGKDWAKKISQGDKHAFEELFFTYFVDLCSYALQITNSNQRAKDIVQEVFYKLWRRREQWSIHTSVKAYLFRAVRNEALNYLDKKEHRQQVREQFSIGTDDRMARQATRGDEADSELVGAIWDVVSDMPQRRQSVFVLHRKHGLSYKEIAEVLDITRKTVENHMGLALDDIRDSIDI